MGKSLLSIRLLETGMLQKDLAEAIGVSPAFISRVTAGEKHLSLERAVNAAIYLGCSVMDLNEWHEIKRSDLIKR